MMTESLAPVGSIESVWCVVGIALLIICVALLLFKRFAGWCMVLTICCIGGLWVGLERGSSYVGDDGGHPIKTTEGYEILWRWEDGTFHLEPQWGWDSIDSLYQSAKKERYYAMHVNGSISPQFFHPDALWVSPLIVVALGLIITPQLWPVWYLLLVWLLKPED